ncbi:Nucleotidyltransferase, predicted [Ceraceosorus bombacis]|uniref:Nucleotidyltransferase, predicted n=1 Tax=Ceraceosorus bombacis TaxID=401625 RepID=A0A0P1BE89_9BASI|nr:Nucleotidyltransferase, predicted [Ceraceosorus bombacis]
MHSRLTCLLDHRSSRDEQQHYALHASFRDARRIFACFFGSQLHGTDTCDSDIDIMGLLLPTPRDMLLGIGASKEVAHRTKAALERNGAEDVDTNFITPLDFIEQLASGQPIAWEMLFAPPHSHAPDTTDEGLAFLAAVREQVPQLLTSSTKAVRGLMDNFERRIKRELQKREMSASDERVQGQLYKSADAKKLAHSLRVCQQAIELYEHGRITLPRPNAEHLRVIKRKEVPLHQVLEQIDQAKSRLLEIRGAGERREISDKTGAYDAIEALVRKHLGMTPRST